MFRLVRRFREPLSTVDKRIVTVVGLLFVTAFALVNYGKVREIQRGCVEIIYGGPTLGQYWPGLSDTSVTVATKRVCAGHGPGAELSSGDVWLLLGAKLPFLVFSSIALLLLCWFLWGAVRPGLHSPVTPGRLRILGWFVVIGGPIAEALQNFFRYEFAAELLKDTPAYRAGKPITELLESYPAWMQELQMFFPWWCVFAGVAALVVAKLLRIEVRMGEEIEGTI